MPSSLELKVPPVLVVLATGGVMAVLAWLVPAASLAIPARLAVGAALAIAGCALCGVGVRSFRRARTTVNPMTPDAASSLVDGGVYAYTRNPMYLGFALLVAGWGVVLANAVSLALVPGFVLYLDRFQIAPEERALSARFGPAFEAYASRVRRWI